jgi:hypothetical protein
VVGGERRLVVGGEKRLVVDGKKKVGGWWEKKGWWLVIGERENFSFYKKQ